MRFEIEHGEGTAVFHREERVLWSGTRPTRLTERQSILLQMLCTMPDRCVSRNDYAQVVSGRDWDPRQRLPLDQHIHSLRQFGLEIASKRGVGYALLGAGRRLDDAAEPGGWRPEPIAGIAKGEATAQFWVDDRGHWLPALPDHECRARQLIGLPDPGASIYLLRRSGFVQLHLGTGWLRAVFDEAVVAPGAIGAVYDFLSTQLGYEKLSLETVARGTTEFDNVVAALAWLERTQGLANRIAPGCVIEEAMDLEHCEVPEIRELLQAWRSSARSDFYDTMQAQIRRARGHRGSMAPIHRVLCIEQDRDGEPVYTEVGPGILLFGANTALYLRGRRVRDQAAPGYAQRAADHYRRALQSDQPILARIRSTVRLEHGVQTLAHLRLSLPGLTSGGRERAVVARTVNV